MNADVRQRVEVQSGERDSTTPSADVDWSALFLAATKVVGISSVAFLIGCCTFSIVYTAADLPEYAFASPFFSVVFVAFGFSVLPVVLAVNCSLWWLAGKLPKTRRSRFWLAFSCFWLGVALMLWFSRNAGDWVMRASAISAGGTTGLVSGMILARLRMRGEPEDSPPQDNATCCDGSETP